MKKEKTLKESKNNQTANGIEGVSSSLLGRKCSVAKCLEIAKDRAKGQEFGLCDECNKKTQKALKSYLDNLSA